MNAVTDEAIQEFVAALRAYGIFGEARFIEVQTIMERHYPGITEKKIKDLIAAYVEFIADERHELALRSLFGFDGEPRLPSLSRRRTRAAYLGRVDVRTTMRDEERAILKMSRDLLTLPKFLSIVAS